MIRDLYTTHRSPWFFSNSSVLSASCRTHHTWAMTCARLRGHHVVLSRVFRSSSHGFVV
ncbi:hypothetical protein BDV95DRAFT_563151 [Massariosphaeria phaeospora]|uniref:Uncharacterized protein n=1 Tax=Massariosphaeria phaeospora TaxID=100035 RepID=A0A7C8IGR7_9PLEO|nr:hypothetical protein BDV95DRAFT_563151 [Massariosphaeria phaeospora]